ncbi:MAG: RadA, partial [Pseudomonadota bacterium]
TTPSSKPRFQTLAGNSVASVVKLAQVKAEALPRTPTGNTEFDRVLGGGLVDGAVILLGGDPGIGKSTLLLQVTGTLSASHLVLYVTGEESPAQVAMRAQRLHVPSEGIQLMAEIRLETILAVIEQLAPSVLVIDSIQTLYTDNLSSAPGSVSQVRECAAALTRAAKTRGMAVILVGHVTKEGTIAGPRVLEHIVDTVLYFEGDTHSNFRLIRAIKNRFGAANELGVFAMTETGLREVSNPSALFLPKHLEPVPGTAILATIEGSRPLLLEVQALVDQAVGGVPRRTAIGVDGPRIAMLLAVLSRHCGIISLGQDVYVNVVGGMRVDEPGSDLASALAIYSSLRNKPLPKGTAMMGEVGLGGEIRPVQRGQDRIREAAKLGFERILAPVQNINKGMKFDIEVVPVPRLSDAVAWVQEQ